MMCTYLLDIPGKSCSLFAQTVFFELSISVSTPAKELSILFRRLLCSWFSGRPCSPLNTGHSSSVLQIWQDCLFFVLFGSRRCSSPTEIHLLCEAS